MKIFLRFVLCITLQLGIFISSGCVQKPEHRQEAAFINLFPEISMNDDLELEVWKMESIDNGNSLRIDLLLKNKSMESISFDVDFSVEILYYSLANDSWERINNSVNYSGNQLVLAPRDNTLLSGTTITIQPEIPDDILIQSIRVVVLGVIMDKEQESNQQVGAYIDMQVNKGNIG